MSPLGATDHPGAWLLFAAAVRLTSLTAALVARRRAGLGRWRRSADPCRLAGRPAPSACSPSARGAVAAVDFVSPRGIGIHPGLLGGCPFGLVPRGPGNPRHRGLRLQRRLLRALERGPDRLRGRRLQRAAGLGRDGLRGGRGDRLPPGLGAHDARHRGPGGDRARARADASSRVSLPGALPRRHRLPRGRLLPPRLTRTVARVRLAPGSGSGGACPPATPSSRCASPASGSRPG